MKIGSGKMKCSKTREGCPLWLDLKEDIQDMAYYGEGLFGCGYYAGEQCEYKHVTKTKRCKK
jgi:hypothetical protein